MKLENIIDKMTIEEICNPINFGLVGWFVPVKEGSYNDQ